MTERASRRRAEDELEKDLEKLLPLPAVTFHVLLSLADGDKHGYAILKDLKRRSEGTVRPGVSTLYAAIQRLEERDLIAETSERPDPALDDERRRYFRLTDRGARVLRAEVRRYERALEMARASSLDLLTGESGGNA